MKGVTVKTSLQKQLAKHRDPNTSRVRNANHEKFKDSFLFDAKEAAQLDVHTIYNLGVEGFESLVGLDQRFQKFERPLFSLAAKEVDRVLLNQDENSKLDKSIHQFLKLASPYFLLAPTGKALEWLIRRFRINQFNVDGLLGFAIPYYGSEPFQKLLSIIELKPTDHWSPFISVRKAKLGVSQDQLVNWFGKDRKFRSFVLQLAAEGATLTPKFSILFTFFTSLMLTYVQSVSEVEIQVLTEILPVLLKGLNSTCSDFTNSCYMVCVLLFTKCIFKTEMLNTITNTLFGSNLNTNLVLVALVKLSDHQPNLFDNSYDNTGLVAWLNSNPEQILQSLKVFSAEYRIRSLVKLLTSTLLKVIVSGDNDPTKLNLLVNLIQDPMLCEKFNLANLSVSLFNIIAKNSFANQQPIATIFTSLELNYENFGNVLAKRISDLASNKSTEKEHTNLVKFSKASHGTSKHSILSETNTSLQLSLTSVDIQTNLLALDRLSEALQQPKAKPFSNLDEVLLQLLFKRNSEVSSKVLDILNSSHKLLSNSLLTKLLELSSTMSSAEYNKTVTLLMQPDFVSTHFEATLPAALQVILNYFTTCEHEDLVVKLGSVKGIKDHFFLKGILNKPEPNNPDNVFLDRLVAELAGSKENLKYLDMLTNLTYNRCPDSVWNFAVLIVLETIISLSKTENGAQLAEDTNLVGKVKLMLWASVNQAVSYSGDPLPPTLLGNRTFYLLSTAKSPVPAFHTLFTIKLCVRKLITYLKETKSAQAWFLQPKEPQTSVNRSLTRLVFEVVTYSEMNHYFDLLGNFVHEVLGSEAYAFLSHIYFYPNIHQTTKTRAITLIAHLLGKPNLGTDSVYRYQLTLPTLLLALTDSSPTIRFTSLIALENLLRSIPQLVIEVYPDDVVPYFGAEASSSVPTVISKKLFARLSSCLNEYSDSIQVSQINLDDLLLQTLSIAELLKSEKKKPVKLQTVFCNFVMNLFAFTDVPDIQTHLLRLIHIFEPKLKLKYLLPKLVTLMQQFSQGAFPAGVETPLPGLLDLFTPKFMKEVVAKHKYVDVLIHGLSLTNQVAGTTTVPHLVIQRLTPELFTTFDREKQKQVYQSLIDLLASEHTELPYLAKRCLFSLPVHTSLVTEVICQLVDQISHSSHPHKKSTASGPKEVGVTINQLTSVLEAVDSKEDLKPYLDLVPSLFSALCQMVEFKSTDTAADAFSGALNYLYQLLMSLLANLFNLASECNLELKAGNWRIDVVVQLLQNTQTMQTHHHTLLLIAAIASIYPEKILNYVMPIFTFMGTNVLQKDDPYTFHILGQTLAKIVPPLLDSFRNEADLSGLPEGTAKDRKLVLLAKPVIDVFVNAILHIPPHRRLKLFQMFVEILGTQFLFGVLSTILEKSVVLNHTSQVDEAKQLSNFALDLASQFKPTVQVLAISELLTSILDLPNCALPTSSTLHTATAPHAKIKANSKKNQNEQPQSHQLNNLFNLSNKSDKQVRNYKFSAVRLSHKLMVAELFLDQLTELEPESYEANYLDEQLVSTSQQLLHLNQNLKAYLGAHQMELEPNTIHFFKQFVGFGYEVLNTALALMTFAAFTDFLVKLLTHDSVTVRYRSMGLLDKRLERSHLELNVQDINQFLTLTPLLTNIITNPQEAPLNKQTAYNCLGLFLRMFSPSYRFDESTEFLDVIIPLLLGEFGLQCPDVKIYSSACLVLSYLCRELDTVMVEKVPQLLPQFLERVQTTIQLEDLSVATTVWLAQFVLLESILAKLADFTTPYLDQIVHILVTFKVELRPKLEAELTLISKVDSTLSMLNFSIEPRSLLPVLFQSFHHFVKADTESTIALLELLTSVILSLTPTNTDKLYLLVFKFYVDAFEFRHRFGSLPEAAIESVEQSLLGGFVQLVMKLRDDSFKPIFLKLGEWATTDLELKPQSISRLTTFYHLIYHLLSNLKQVFAPYYVYTIDHATQTLTRPSADSSPQLVKFLLRATTLSLQYDTEGLWTTDRFFQNLPALLHQIQLTTDLDFATEYLVPTLVQLSQTVTYDEARKKLNLSLAQLTRSENLLVKVVVLKAIQALYLAHQKLLLPYLPETIPFLAEVLEEDDIQVQHACRELLLTIEKFNGEPLDQYFR